MLLILSKSHVTHTLDKMGFAFGPILETPWIYSLMDQNPVPSLQSTMLLSEIQVVHCLDYATAYVSLLRYLLIPQHSP